MPVGITRLRSDSVAGLSTWAISREAAHLAYTQKKRERYLHRLLRRVPIGMGTSF